MIKRYFLFIVSIFISTSCGFKVENSGSNNSSIISGVVSPFVGAISSHEHSNFFIQAVNASACSDPVYSKLFLINADGTIDESKPLVSQVIGSDARYTFNLKEIGFSKPSSNVEYLVTASGCNGDTFKRPVTKFDTNQNLDAKTTVISEVVNASPLLSKTLNNVSRAQVELLLNSVSGSSVTAALDSLTTNQVAYNQFTEIFGSSPTVIQNARPEVKVTTPATTINELVASHFESTIFHIDPNYSAAYVWKLDGVVKATTASWAYIPGATDSGSHFIDLYIGKNDGNGGIDLTKPFYSKTFNIIVNNNILPTAPVLSLNSLNVSPVSTQSVVVYFATGAGLSNCFSFSHLAITESNTTPGIMQFNLACTNAGSQQQTVSISSGDGQKTLYLWAMDNEGNISSPRSLSFVLDTLPPVSTLSFSPTLIKGGTSQSITLSAYDEGIGLDTLDLFVSTNGGSTYSLISRVPNNSSNYLWTTPTINSTQVQLKLVATDLTGAQTIKTTSLFTIDSLPPAAPMLTRSSAEFSSSSSVNLSLICDSDFSKVLFTQSASTPNEDDSSWENCSTSKTFVVSNTDGLKTIYAFAKDSVGNISTAASASMNLDTLPPSLTLTSFTTPQYYAGGSSKNITWSLTDANLTTTPVSIAYSTDGSTYTDIGTNLINSGSYNWSLPSLNSSSVTLKITAADKAGNIQSKNSEPFSIDSTNPSITTFTLSNGTASVALPSTSVQISANDTGSGITHMRFSENPVYANTNWQTYSPASGTYNLSLISGNKTVYAWVKDLAGNVSSFASTNINLDFGNPPSVSIISPTASSGSFSSGSNVHIEWSCSSTNGLQTNPARIKYTTNDGSSFIEATSWLPNNLTSTTGSYEWTLPAGVSVFRLLVECNSAAGVIASAYSAPINTSGWSIFAGDPSSMNENINASLAVMIKGSPGFQTIAVDKSGNIFFEKNSVMMKIDSQTGLVTRFAGDPSSNSCNMQAGSDPLNSSFNRIGNNFSIFGMNQARDSIIFGACNNVWLFNTSTRALSVLNNNGAYNGSSWFFSRNGFLYYISSAYLYKLNLNTTNQTPVAIMGTGSCSPVTAAAGTSGLSSPLPGTTSGTCAGENYVYTNMDETKVWIGCWNGVSSCQNAASLVWDSTNNRYNIGSNNVGWTHQDADKAKCVPSYISDRIWCSSRYNTTNRIEFDTVTEVWKKTTYGKTIFVRFAASPTGMVSLSSDNFLMSYLENSDNTVTAGQIGGSDIETYANGEHYKKAAFGAVEDITYSSVLNELFIDTSVKIRKASLNTNQIFTTNYSGYLNRITVNKSGTRFASIYNCGGNNYIQFAFDGNVFSASPFVIMSRNGCGQSVFDATHPVISGTSVNSRVDWILDYNRRPLHHTNGKFYFSTASSDGSNAFIFSSNGTIINRIAGSAGAAGYNPAHSGGLALSATLTNVRAIWEIPSGKPNAGDLLIVDNNFLKLITIATESGNPKIYDITSFSLALGYGSNSSNTFSDVVYDFDSELLNASSQPILGTGAFYYVVSSSNTVRKFIVNSVSGNTPIGATDTAYSFTGTTLTGNIRLALTPAGLLVTQPNKNRILRVAP